LTPEAPGRPLGQGCPQGDRPAPGERLSVGRIVSRP